MILLTLITLNYNKEYTNEFEQPATDQIEMNFNLKSSPNTERSKYSIMLENPRSLTALLPYCLDA
jgi:hypothetical protein